MTKKFIVYMHTNKINNKHYVGITCQQPEKRWGANGYGYRDQPKFYNAILKYGWDNFTHEIIADDLSNKEALELETEYIHYLDSINNGYNVLEKGISSYYRGRSVYNLTTQTKYDTIVEAAKSINTNPYSIIKNCKGKCGPVKGTSWAYWDEEKQTYITPPVYAPKEKSNSRKIICLETKKIYKSILEASKEIGVNDSDLRKVIRGTRNGIRGYHFLPLQGLTPEKVVEVLNKPNGFKTRVYCKETGDVFESLQEASQFCGKTAQSVMKNCQGLLESCANYHFFYLNALSAQQILEIYKYDNTFWNKIEEEDND